jgi:hypothetical protein
VELDGGISSSTEVLDIGWIDGVTPDYEVGPSMAVEFTGRTSGHVDVMIAALNVEYEFHVADGSSYCFEDTLELQRLRQRLLTSRGPVRSGDSGAWVCTLGDAGTEWCAMVIGEDGIRGYAIYAVDVLRWLQSEGYPLSPSTQVFAAP